RLQYSLQALLPPPLPPPPWPRPCPQAGPIPSKASSAPARPAPTLRSASRRETPGASSASPAASALAAASNRFSIVSPFTRRARLDPCSPSREPPRLLGRGRSRRLILARASPPSAALAAR